MNVDEVHVPNCISVITNEVMQQTRNQKAMFLQQSPARLSIAGLMFLLQERNDSFKKLGAALSIGSINGFDDITKSLLNATLSERIVNDDFHKREDVSIKIEVIRTTQA